MTEQRYDAVLGVISEGFGRQNRSHRLVLAGAALLLLISLPTAFGIIESVQQAATKPTHFLLFANPTVGLPGGTKVADQMEYRGFVLLRETPTKYWVMQLGLATNAYSVAKTDVRYVRY